MAFGPFNTSNRVVPAVFPITGMKEAGTDIAIGLDYSRNPRRIAPRSGMGLQSIIGAEVRENAT